MRLVFVLACAAVLAAHGCVGTPSQPANVAPTATVSAIQAAATATPTEVCHGLAHVYNPGQLHVLGSCVSVRGVIISARQERDGDLHVLLKVDVDQRDPRGGRFTNSVNDAKQGGDLVLEPVCEGPVTQQDAVAACAGYHNPLAVPRRRHRTLGPGRSAPLAGDPPAGEGRGAGMNSLRQRWCTYVALTLFVVGLIVWARFYAVLVDFAAAHGFPGWQHYVWPIILLGPLAMALLLISRRCSR